MITIKKEIVLVGAILIISVLYLKSKYMEGFVNDFTKLPGSSNYTQVSGSLPGIVGDGTESDIDDKITQCNNTPECTGITQKPGWQSRGPNVWSMRTGASVVSEPGAVSLVKGKTPQQQPQQQERLLPAVVDSEAVKTAIIPPPVKNEPSTDGEDAQLMSMYAMLHPRNGDNQYLDIMKGLVSV